MTRGLVSRSRVVASSALTAAVFTLLLAPPARGQGSEPADGAAALTLFEQGKKLAADGNYLEGCPKLLASYTLIPKLGTLLNLADCYERSGRTASAWVRFTEAATMAERAGQRERADFASAHAAMLVPRLSRVSITVASPAPEGLVVKRDNVVVDHAAFGTPIPVDPGTHVIEASAPHRTTWTRDVAVAHDVSAETSVVVPILLAEVVDTPLVVSPLGDARPTSSPSSASSAGPPTETTQRTVAFVLGGVGIASVAGSLVVGVLARSEYASSNTEGGCVGNRCTDRGLDQRSSASTLAGISTGLFIGGALLAGAGVVLYLTRPRDPSSASSAPAAARAALLRGVTF